MGQAAFAHKEVDVAYGCASWKAKWRDAGPVEGLKGCAEVVCPHGAVMVTSSDAEERGGPDLLLL